MSSIFQFLSGALLTMTKVARIFYEQRVPEYLASANIMKLHLVKIEKIKKQNKSIDDLLRWNREVSSILR